MKKTIKYAFAALAFFAFTACGSENNTASESETTNDATEMETDMNDDMNSDLEGDTATLRDQPVNDGVADSIPEERPTM
ncbi:hypothetical protein [Pontibacter sp. SGAir0037]|uniref:hypothetical protein n=1 Tax=Pontibacter sp. SGAir0037 TaxID=2571030 RepID=UPI0010CD50F1|nr:hypothetical protein [Pontibacter sp. SGAir0037]QCR23850.1 hypothetical protein C1N53_16840 [Pontibacter sp. SGAir0037]